MSQKDQNSVCVTQLKVKDTFSQIVCVSRRKGISNWSTNFKLNSPDDQKIATVI